MGNCCNPEKAKKPVENFEIIELENFRKVGIYNEGNTCYMNSVLQILFHNADFINKIRENMSENLENNSLTDIFKEILQMYQQQIRGNVSISKLLNAFRKNSNLKRYTEGNQQDSLEFMLNLLKEIEKDIKLDLANLFESSHKNQIACTSCDYKRQIPVETAAISLGFENLDYLYLYEKEGDKSTKSLIGNFFFPPDEKFFLSYLKNFKCIKKYYNDSSSIEMNRKKEFNINEFRSELIEYYKESAKSGQPLILILLEDRNINFKINQEDILRDSEVVQVSPNPSLYDLIFAFTKPQLIEFNCRCGKNQFEQNLVLEEVKNYLIIKLNRKSAREKILKLPLNKFDFEYFMNEEKEVNNGSCSLKLLATIDHFGSTRGGHYIAKILDEKENIWYSFNDSSVSPVEEKQISQNENSIILIYKRIKKQYIPI